jgi:hypothetical protein
VASIFKVKAFIIVMPFIYLFIVLKSKSIFGDVLSAKETDCECVGKAANKLITIISTIVAVFFWIALKLFCTMIFNFKNGEELSLPIIRKK